MDASPAATPSVSRWWVLALVHLSMMAFAINLQMIPPLVPRLVSETGLTHTGAGVLMGLFTLPGIFLAIPGGRAADLLGPRGVALWSLSLLTIGAFLMLVPHPGLLYFGRLCAGIGGAVLVVVSPQIVARSFRGSGLGMAMGIFNTAVPLGTILAFNVLGYIGGAFGVTAVFMAAASFCLVSLTAFALTYKDHHRTGDESAPQRGVGLRDIGAGIWLVSLIWVLFNISILSYFTYAIDHYIEGGLAAVPARFMTSLPMLLSILLTPVAGLAMHRYGLRWSLTTGGCLLSSAAVSILYFSGTTMVLTWSIVLGVGISMVPPAVFTLAGELVPPSGTGTGYGLLSALFNLGVFTGIPLIGYLRDVTPDYRSSFILMAAIMAAGGGVSAASAMLISK